jgi:chemotaxis methyl-accepting protein methylase
MEETKFQKIKSSITELSKELGKNFVVSNDGEIREIYALGCSSGQCTVSYTNCITKKSETVCLDEGDTLIYGDWDGSSCKTKEYKCQIA